MKLIVLGPNFYRVRTENVTVWFSYETAIAFSVKGTLVIHENIWSRTTAKHLNEVGPEKDRVSEEVFAALWKEMMPPEMR